METYIGHIKTPHDALLIFEACRRGELHRVQRRLSSKERVHIRSGSIFAWDEREAGMRRWTDGRTWSPSRVLGSFLTYRELDTRRRPRRNKGTPVYSYKANGLIKQSFSICTATDHKLHLISYYTKADVLSGRLRLPSEDPQLAHIVVPKGLYPELNPLETSGGHSATIHSMIRQQQQENEAAERQKPPSPPPSLSSSPVSSDDDTMGDLLSPVHSYLPFHQRRRSLHLPSPSTSNSLQPPPNATHQELFCSTSPVHCRNTTTTASAPSCASSSSSSLLLLPSIPNTSFSEDQRQLKALQVRL